MEYSFDPPERSAEPWLPPMVGDEFAAKQLCGRSLNGGLLRFHDTQSGPSGQELVDQAFRPRGLEADVFAYDWLARQFAVTRSVAEDGTADPAGASRTVVVLDPFDMSITPWVEVQQFEKALSVPMAQQFLNYSLFSEWLITVGIDHLSLDYCAGASVPAFYGGERGLENLSLDPVDVYLSFSLQLWARAQNSAPGSAPPRLSMPEGR